MTDETGASAGGEAVAVIEAPANTGDELSYTQAAKALIAARSRKPEQSAESAEEATAETELPDEGNAAPAEEQATSETQEDDPAEEPSLDLPRSWTKEQSEHWKALPRAMQEYLHSLAGKESEAVRRAQNEAAEKSKAYEAKFQEAEKLRQQYEAKLPALEKKLQTVGPFADIQSMQDIRNMKENEPFRFLDYQVYIWEQQAEQQELRDAESRKAQERQNKRNAYEAEQNKSLVELVPEMADPKKANELRERAIAMLTDDLGLKNDQLARWMQDDTGHEILSNAGIQKLIADGLKYRDIRNAPKAVVKADLPPVQRPGTSKPSGAVNSERIQALTRQLNETGSLKVAQQLRALQSRRAS